MVGVLSASLNNLFKVSSESSCFEYFLILFLVLIVFIFEIFTLQNYKKVFIFGKQFVSSHLKIC